MKDVQSLGFMTKADFLEILARRNLQLPLSKEEDAIRIVSSYSENWGTICMQFIVPNETKIGIHKIIDAITTTTSSNSPNWNLKPDGYEVQGRAPFFEETPQILRIFLIQHYWFALAAIIFEMGPLIMTSEAARKSYYDPEAQIVLMDPQFLSASADVAVEKARMLPFVEKLEQKVEASRIEYADRENEYRSKIDELIKSRETEWIVFKETKTNELDAIKKQISESFVFDGAQSLWQKKSHDHSWRFWLGFIAMTLCIAIIVDWLFNNGRKYIFELSAKGDGDLTYATILMVAICILLIAWILRFMARFVLDNMAMQTDASHRRVMIQTYLALVGQTEAKMDPADRAIILSAIFRPLPGQQTEELAPPTILDLVKQAAPKP